MTDRNILIFIIYGIAIAVLWYRAGYKAGKKAAKIKRTIK